MGTRIPGVMCVHPEPARRIAMGALPTSTSTGARAELRARAPTEPATPGRASAWTGRRHAAAKSADDTVRVESRTMRRSSAPGLETLDELIVHIDPKQTGIVGKQAGSYSWISAFKELL
jgi:hypothetical protein